MLLMVFNCTAADYKVLPNNVNKGIMYTTDTLKIEFSPTFDKDNMTNYIAVIEKNGKRVKMDQKYNRKTKVITLVARKPFVAGDEINLIFKKMAKSGNYFHLVEVMKKSFKIVSKEVSVKKIKKIIKAKPEEEKVLSKMKSILSSDDRISEHRVSKKVRKSEYKQLKDSENIAWFEDVLDVKVWGHNDLNMKLRIDEKGNVTYPLIGEFSVFGKSSSVIATIIKEKLEDGYIRKAYVLVDIVKKGKKKIKIKVIGNVSKTGIQKFDYEPSIIDLMAMVGAPTGSKGASSWNGVKVRIVNDESVIVEEASNLLKNIQESKKLILMDGSIVYFTFSQNIKKIYVLGSVLKPGKYDHYEGMTVLDSLVEAGGTKGQSYAYSTAQDHFRANLRQVMVIRKNVAKKEVNIMVVNMQDVMFRGKMEYNITLRAGDWIVVPQKRVKNIYTYISRLSPVLNFVELADSVIKIFK